MTFCPFLLVRCRQPLGLGISPGLPCARPCLLHGKQCGIAGNSATEFWIDEGGFIAPGAFGEPGRELHVQDFHIKRLDAVFPVVL